MKSGRNGVHGRERSGTAVLAAVLVALALAACGQAASTPEPQEPQLRVMNNGRVAIEDLVVIFPGGRAEFGDVAPGATTEYRSVPGGVYRYAAYELGVGGQRVQQPVTDWVGEEPVPGRAFTYVLDVDPSRSPTSIVQLVEATVDR